MTGLCGWVGGVPSGSAEATLAAMARGLPPVAGQTDSSIVQPQAGVLACGWPDSVFLHEEDGILAALVGEPSWSDPGLAALARQHGHGKALVAAYRQHGHDLFHHLRGAFSVAVVCPAQGTALLGIDRVGIHGMCYATVPGGGLVFGTTTDAVRAHAATSATITPQTVFDYLQFYICPAPATIYREQSKLPIAHYLSFDGSIARSRPYWQMPYRAATASDPAALAEELHALLRKSIRNAAEGADLSRTGAFLSGGLDSSTVCGLFAGLSDDRARSYTIAFDDPRYDESRYAKITADHFGLDAKFYTLTSEDAGSFIPQLAAAYDEPFGNSSAIPTYFCAKTAGANGMTDLLAGDGGDELFAGNERYVEQQVFEHYAALPPALRRFALSPAIRAFGRLDSVSLFRRAANYVRMADIPLPYRLYSRHPLVCHNFADLFARDAGAEIDTDHWQSLLASSYDAADGSSRVQRMMNLDLQITLADNDLRKVVRMCELAGCRVRFPLLNDELVEFSAGIPAQVLLQGGRLRGFYKTAMKGFLPDDILTKSKHGFGMPFDSWTQQSGAICELLCDSLSALAARDIFNPATIHELIDAHRSDSPSPWRDIAWDLMIFELWWQSRDGLSSALRPGRSGGKSAMAS